MFTVKESGKPASDDMMTMLSELLKAKDAMQAAFEPHKNTDTPCNDDLEETAHQVLELPELLIISPCLFRLILRLDIPAWYPSGFT